MQVPEIVVDKLRDPASQAARNAYKFVRFVQRSGGWRGLIYSLFLIQWATLTRKFVFAR